MASTKTVGSVFSKDAKARRVFFTVNNPEGLLDFDAFGKKGCTFLLYQKEKGEEKGTPHYQGVMLFSKQMRLSALKKLPGMAGAHFEVVHDLQASIAYCKKESTRIDGPWEHGALPEQGKRSDLTAVKKDLDQGMPLASIAQVHFAPFVRYHRSFALYKRLMTPPRNFKTVCILLVGPSGVGKSRTAHCLASYLSGNDVFFVAQPKGSGLYFDDYAGQETMIIDEMDGATMTPTTFNALVDRYPHTLPAHGSAGQQMVSKYLIITSNYLPKYWWKKRSPAQIEQTTRRIEWLWPMLRLDQGARGFACLLNGKPHVIDDVQPYSDLSVPNPLKKLKN